MAQNAVMDSEPLKNLKLSDELERTSERVSKTQLKERKELKNS